MELIAEIINRAGRTLERHRLRGDTISIGRAYDNQLILSDDTVNPHHALIQGGQDQSQLITDLDSANGIKNERHAEIETPAILESGKTYIFGKTRVRLFRPDHPMSATVSLNQVDTAINYLGSSVISFASILLLVSLTALQVWANLSEETKWDDYFNPIFGVLAVALIVTLFWCLIGRIVKHEMRFKSQFTLVSIYFSLAYCELYLYELFIYNSMSFIITSVLYVLISIVMLATLFWFNLHIATHQSNPQRWKLAGTLSVIIVSVSMLPEIIEQTNFSTRPHYITEIKPPAVRLVSGNGLDEFLEQSSGIFLHE